MSHSKSAQVSAAMSSVNIGNSENKFLDDTEVWLSCPPEDLWVFDKLILSRKLGYVCGPRGVKVPKPGNYIVRPCINLMGMGRSAKIVHIDEPTDNIVEDGCFWSEIFEGRHLSVDYENGKQVLCVEGIRSDNDPLWRWQEWRRVDDIVKFPDILKSLASRHSQFNVEMIGGNIIEVHLRLNPNFKHDSIVSIIPKFEGDDISSVDGYTFVEDKEYKRLGFFVK